MKFLARIVKRALSLFRRRNVELAESQHACTAADVFCAHDRKVWTDDICSPARGGKRFRENERYIPRQFSKE